jgi:plasmid stability protein
METIQIRVPSSLAQELLPYQSELPRVLEMGLRQLKKREAAHAKESENEDRTVLEQTIAALQQAGAIGPTLAAISQYVTGSENRTWKPIVAPGKPASQMILDERQSYAWSEE